MIKYLLSASVIAATSAFAAQATTVAPKNVDLMFVIDRSGSMSAEGATLSARIGEVMNGIAADSRIGSVQAGVVSFEDDPLLVSAVTGSVVDLQTAINSIVYDDGEEDGLQAMASVLPGGNFFNTAGWRSNTVRSIVLLTDEDSDDNDAGDFPGNFDYAAFGALLDAEGYLNNVIVSNLGNRCSGLGGSSTSGGCEYISTSRPTGGDAAFDLIDFVLDTDTFITNFIDTKIDEIVVTDPVDPGVVPLPAAGWMLLAGIGGLAAMKRRKKAS